MFENSIDRLLEQLGITSSVVAIMFFVVKAMIERSAKKQEEHATAMEKKNEEIAKLQEWGTRERKAARDLEMEQIRKSVRDGDEAFMRHVQIHMSFEKDIKAEIDKMYSRLNCIGEMVARIEGSLEHLNNK